MDDKDKRLLDAMNNAYEELIKVMNRKIDHAELDPEKLKISASAFRLAVEDAMVIKTQIEMLSVSEDDAVEKKDSFFGVENRIK